MENTMTSRNFSQKTSKIRLTSLMKQKYSTNCRIIKRSSYLTSELELNSKQITSINSINLPIDEVSVEDLMKMDENVLLSFTEHNAEEGKALLAKYKRLFVAIIVSQEKVPKEKFKNPDFDNYDELLKIGKILTFYKMLISNKIRELGIFSKGFRRFEQNFGFILSAFDQDFHTRRNINYPSALFSTKIFVGNQHQALSKEIIETLKITHIVNATKHLTANKFDELGVKYVNVAVEDNETNKISPYFKQTFDFINEALSEGKLENGVLEKKESNIIGNVSDLLESVGNNQFLKAQIMEKAFKDLYSHTNNNNRIFIHCSLGVSRSSTIAIMFIMKRFSIPFKEACSFVQFQKENSCPINCFVYELEEFEKKANNF